jgi:N utilization substance protein B
MQALYAHEQSGTSPSRLAYMIIEPKLEDDAETRAFAERLFQTTIDTMEEADEIIAKHATNWDIHRIAVVDRSLLRMATTEFLEFEEIPPKVSIDEALEIAKVYSTPSSNTFINGVLDAVLMDLERQDRLHKTGRGLIGMDAIRERAQSS